MGDEQQHCSLKAQRNYILNLWEFFVTVTNAGLIVDGDGVHNGDR